MGAAKLIRGDDSPAHRLSQSVRMCEDHARILAIVQHLHGVVNN